MNNNQENQRKVNSWGGKREGAGRPKGSAKRPQIRDYLTKEQVEDLISKAYDLAREGDTTMLRFILEQIHGKAAQSIDHTTGGESLAIMFDSAFKERDETASEAEGDS